MDFMEIKSWPSSLFDLFQKYSLPHSWSNSLLRALLSNDYQKRISITQGLPDYLLGGALGWKGSADALEVLKIVFWYLDADLLVYFATLRLDPLYLFTSHSLDDYLTEMLEEAWMPLLAYIQEFYSYPIRLNGFRTMSLTSNISKTDIVFKAKNFVYNQPQSYDITTSRAFQSLIAIVPIDSDIKDGFTTTLTVHIPKHRDHPFWLLNSTQSKEKLFGCEKIQDTLTFQVTRWGPLPELSNFNATQRAMDIIRNIRAAVSNPIHLSRSPCYTELAEIKSFAIVQYFVLVSSWIPCGSVGSWISQRSSWRKPWIWSSTAFKTSSTRGHCLLLAQSLNTIRFIDMLLTLTWI